MGMGYIGLPTAALLAKNGYQVCGVDVKKNVVDIINDGKVHIFEPDLDSLVSSSVNDGLLIASTEPKESDIFIIAVPTPFHKNKSNKITNTPVPNIDYIIDAIVKIAPFIRAGNLVLLEST